MRKFLCGCAALAVLAGVGGIANAQTVTFDDLSDFQQVYNGYAGLNWDNFVTIASTNLAGTGYQNGNVSAPNSIYNASSNPGTISATTIDGFTLTSADFTAAWASQTVFVNGFTVNGDVLSDSFLTITSGPVLHTFNWTNVASVTFTSSNAQIVIDNLTLNPASVPEPASWALMLGGFGFVGGAMRSRKRAASFA